MKKWRDEWAETYKWAYVAVHEGIHRIFCSVCKEYGRKHRRNPYGNEGSRNMQMSALEEHNNSLLHKEALRLQLASKDQGMGLIDRPVYMKGEHDFHIIVIISFFFVCSLVCCNVDSIICETVPHLSSQSTFGLFIPFCCI